MRLFRLIGVSLILLLSNVNCLRTPLSTRLMMSDKPKVSSSTIQGVGDEGCRLASPSGVNMMPLPQQALVFAAVTGGLYACTNIGIGVYETFYETFPAVVSAWKSTWGLLGPIYALAGVSHFYLKEDFMNIMPAWGAWGFWYLPGSKQFHVVWTGIVEIIAGLWLGLATLFSFLNVSSLPTIWANPIADASAVLLSLTILVTPTNIYMVTIISFYSFESKCLISTLTAQDCQFPVPRYALFFL